MSDLIEVYTRLKMKTDCLITLTYFSSYGYETTKKYKLIDIVGFSYILVENEEEMLSIPFFGKDTMIKSITIDNSKESIYFNKYVNENIFNGFYVKDGYVEIDMNHCSNYYLTKAEFDKKNSNPFIAISIVELGLIISMTAFYIIKNKKYNRIS